MEMKNAQKIRTISSIAAGVLTILCALFGFLMIAVYAGEAEKYAVIFAAAGAVLLLAAGAALIFCRRAEISEMLRPIACVQERKGILILAVFTWLLGAVLVFCYIVLLVVPPADFVTGGILAAAGAAFLLCGIWAFLAVRNRCLFLFSDGTMTYYTSWGRQKNFMQTQVSHVQIGANGSVRLKNADGKTLVSVENNMLGMEELGEWLEKREITIKISEALERLKLQEEKEEGTAETTEWKEADRTELHDHIREIRIAVTGTVIWFVLSALVPVGLYLMEVIKYRSMIYLTASSALPFFICYLFFAPVISLNGKPKKAAEEWKAMHVHASVWLLLLPMVLLMNLYIDVFSEVVLQVVDEWRLMGLWAVIGIGVWGMLFWRTPKRLRGEGIFMMIFFCLGMGYPMAYGLNLSLCSPAVHYPAEVVEREIKQDDEDSTDYFLTVRLEDGTEMEFDVPERLFLLERVGQEIQVCQRNSLLGIRMADLHLPE